MQQRKIVDVFMGTRPEAIKMAPVVAALRQSSRLQCRVVATGQHREMFRQIAAEFGLSVDVDLDAMVPDQTLAGLSARLMLKIDDWLQHGPPDMALVQGDTTTVLVASLACFYRRIPVGHVEAGLRTGSIMTPFPEELNRRLASRMVALHFAPTASARSALLREGVPDEAVQMTGNTVVDALFMELGRQKEPGMRDAIERALASAIAPDWSTRPYVLITGHRRENFGGGFEQICAAIRSLALRYPDFRFVYPVHLNPNVKRPVESLLGDIGNVVLIPPQGYRNFVALMSKCRLVLTDSGGVQEEAPSLGKPVLVMRETTERPEGVEAGTARLVGADTESIVRSACQLLDDPAAYDAMANAASPYGDGHAAARIAATVERYLLSGTAP